MLIKDRIYGNFKIDDPVLIELIKCPTVQRLKGVSTRGYPKHIANRPGYYTRYEHSVGCMLLLRKLGADLEEQIAGLLHDVSHTAFSHVIDWVIGVPTKEDYQDKILKHYIERSEIPEILERHGFDSKKISEIEEADHFGLMERKAPQLCVDRLDYSLRDMHNRLNKNVTPFINNLTTLNGHVVFGSYKHALRYAKLYATCERNFWASSDDMVRYHLMSIFLRTAMDEKVISQKDFHLTENKIISRIRSRGNKKLIKQMNTAFGLLKYRVSKNGIHLTTKFRRINPEFIEGSKISRVMERNQSYRKQIRRQELIEKAGITVKISGI